MLKARYFLCYILTFLPLLLASQVTFWQTLYGGSGHDFGREVLLLDDGTILMAGEVSSKDGIGQGLHGNLQDVVVTRYATQGVTFWRKVLGGSGEETVNQLIELDNGDLALIGTTDSKDGDLATNYGGTDVWVTLLSRQGRVKWSKSFGGSGNDRGISIHEIPGEGMPAIFESIGFV